jgi:uncharacterized protein YciI
MAREPSSEVTTLIRPMIRKNLWAVLSTARVSSEQMEPHAAEHLRYMNALEAKGVLWASGPFVVPGVIVGDGLTIFNVPEEADVRRLMDVEPLTSLGLRTYQIRKWELREGKISVEVFCSQSRFELT